jgi:hypothetical protein
MESKTIRKAAHRCIFTCPLFTAFFTPSLFSGCDRPHSIPEKRNSSEMTSEAQVGTNNETGQQNEESLQVADCLRELSATTTRRHQYRSLLVV